MKPRIRVLFIRVLDKKKVPLILFTPKYLKVSVVQPVFLNVYGAQESIPRNEFRQPM